MKKIFILIIFLPLLSFGQNWQTVPVGQHNIYRVSIHLNTADTVWDGYVRNIYIDNSVFSASGTQHNFYRSLRRNQNELLDSVQGPTWLGRSFFRKNNGDEIYLNKYQDTLLIKTMAGMNATWTLGYDTSGTKRFEATIVNVDTMTIDGVLDSVKRISIKTFIGLTQVPSIYDVYLITLSKNHGFWSVFDIYGFPNYENAVLSENQSLFPDTTKDIYPILPYIHARQNTDISTRPYGKTDLAWQYQPGNEWITQLNGPGKLMPVYQYDSIISVALVNSDSVITTFKRELLSWQNIAPPPFQQYTRLFTSSIITDTILKEDSQRTLVTDSLENKIHYPYWSYEFQWSFLDFYCTNKMAVRDTTYNSGNLSSDAFYNNYFLEDFNLNGFNNMAINPPSNFHFENRPLYVNINGCSYGNFFSLRASSISNVYNRNDLFKIYPNPTSNKLHIDTDLEWEKLDILSMQGKIVRSYSQTQQHSIDVSELPHGLYFVKISSENGNFIYKLIKN